MQIIKQPAIISLTGRDNTFQFKTDLFVNWKADRVKIDLSQVQLIENYLFGFVLDGILIELVAKDLPTLSNHIQADDAAKTNEENSLALGASLRQTKALVDYKIEVDTATSSVYISNFDAADIKFSIPDDPIYDFTRETMTFQAGTQLGAHQLDSIVVGVGQAGNVAHLSAAFEKGIATINPSYIANTLIKKQTPNFTTNIVWENRDSYLAKYFIRFAEMQSSLFSRFQDTDIFYLLDGYERIGKGENFLPHATRVSLLQYSQNRVIGRNQADWAVFFFPYAMQDMELHTYEYDKDGVLLRDTKYDQLHATDKSIRCIGTGTGQLPIDPLCVRYNVQIEVAGGGAMLGIEYEIDDNNYLSDTRILYWNRKGGFDVLSAKGLGIEEFKIDSDIFVSENDGLSIKTNSKYRTFQFNTGYTMSEEEFVTWADMQGSEIHVVFPGNIRFVKMIMEKLELALPKKKGELWSVSFTARMAKDDF